MNDLPYRFLCDPALLLVKEWWLTNVEADQLFALGELVEKCVTSVATLESKYPQPRERRQYLSDLGPLLREAVLNSNCCWLLLESQEVLYKDDFLAEADTVLAELGSQKHY